jgi:hypothetical protein
MTAACDLLEAELALDRIDADLAAELPAHMRAFAAAHARGAPVPPAPAVLQRPVTLVAAQQALAHPLLEDRARAILRLVVPIAIEDDPRVIAARASDPTWDALAVLTAARDAVARERFDTPFVALMHQLYGVGIAAREVAWPPMQHAWHAADGAPAPDLDEAWRALAAEHGADGVVEIRRAAARPRTFVVVPQRHVIVVVPDALSSPAARFAVLHEFGHALVALLAPLGVARVVDEAAAAYVARAMEDAASPWFSPLAAAARARRVQLAMALDAIERSVSSVRPTERPPWALWHDPAAQAAYVEAEAIADRWSGPLAACIAGEAARGPL